MDGDWAFCIMNTSEEDVTLTVDWSALEVNDPVSKRRTSFGSVNYSVKDLWNPEAPVFPTLVKGKGILREQFVINAFDVTVKSHDVVAYRLTPVK